MTSRSLEDDLSLSNHLVAEFGKGFRLLQALFLKGDTVPTMAAPGGKPGRRETNLDLWRSMDTLNTESHGSKRKKILGPSEAGPISRP